MQWSATPFIRTQRKKRTKIFTFNGEISAKSFGWKPTEKRPQPIMERSKLEQQTKQHHRLEIWL